MIHKTDHPLAGQKVSLNQTCGDPVRNMVRAGEVLEISNWVDRMDDLGKSWMDLDNNWAAIHYAMRSGTQGLPLDNEVVYGHIGGLGHMVHVSELGDPV
jgi:hypothetical protein